jgi:hypothetical protein
MDVHRGDKANPHDDSSRAATLNLIIGQRQTFIRALAHRVDT